MLKFWHKLKKKSPNRKKIMLRCSKSISIVYEEEGEEKYSWKEPLIYDCFEYYVVDLKHDRDGLVLERYCAPLLDEPTGPGDLICLGSFIYSIPLLFYCAYENVPPSLPYPNTGELVDRLTQMFFTNSQNPKKWTPISFVVPEDFHCAALSGVIYGLESGRLNNALRFEPSENSWYDSNAPPPPYVHESEITGRMIPDPINERILVHLDGGNLNLPSLFAWHPKIVSENGVAWKYLQPFNSNLWYQGSTLMNIDNRSLLFFFFHDMKELFKVWSLEDEKFLEIYWCNEFPRLEFNVVRAHSMCCLGNNQLCLALSCPPVEYNDVPVTFLIFDIKRLSKSDIKSKGKKPAGDTSLDCIIAVAYVASKSFQASDTKRLVDITCLGEVY